MAITAGPTQRMEEETDIEECHDYEIPHALKTKFITYLKGARKKDLLN